MSTITTERLTLRMLDADEAALVVEFVTRNREHLRPWEPTRTEAHFRVDHWREMLSTFAADQAAGTHVRRFLLRHGRVIGAVNLNNVVRGAFQSAYLGFSLDAESQGQGLMHEALRAVIDHAFSRDGLYLHRIEANHQPHNEKSASVLHHLGFERQGFAKDYLFLDGAWRDHVMLALVNRAFSF